MIAAEDFFVIMKSVVSRVHIHYVLSLNRWLLKYGNIDYAI